MSSVLVNAKEVLQKLNLFKQKLPERTRERMEKVCLKVEADSKKNCPPSITGNLRASITHKVVDEEDGEIAGYVGSNLDYAPYVHQGTGIYAIEGNGRKQVPWSYYDERKGEWQSTEGIKPTPFIQMAIDENMDDIINYFKGVMEDGD